MNDLKRKFSPAWHGIKNGLEHRSVRIQVILGSLAIIVSFFLKLTIYEWLAVIVCIANVVAFEYINTAIEKLSDLYTTCENEKIKIIKDISAAAVLVMSIGSLVCAIVILCAHIFI